MPLTRYVFFRANEMRSVLSIDTFLDRLSPKKRSIFVSRYWYTDSISEIAVRHNMSDGAVSMTLNRIRLKLHNYLLERGFEL
ncbi:RNA polymerase sigma factor [Dysosmobacter sp.]|uniref:RNA polymerase sigma factor n=1 Tax=Dysosmobacter sp. TaxID=2591382 RepID=UPI003A95549A